MSKTIIRRTVPLLAAILSVLLILAITGCGGDGASTTTQKQSGSDYEEGEVISKTTRTITEEELGVPMYPGAELKSDKATVTVSTGPEGKWELTEAYAVTGDPVSTVTDWYRKELSSEERFEDLSYDMDGQTVGMFDFVLGDEERTVVVEKSPDGSGTQIRVDLQKRLD